MKTMQTRTMGASLVGATVIYVAMAACGGSGGKDDLASQPPGSTEGIPGAPASSSGSSGSDPTSPAAEGGLIDAILDQLTNPVPDAHAAAPDVAVETCNKTYPAGSVTMAYAEHLYPGKTVNDLSGVRVVVHTAAPANMPGPYHDYVTVPMIRDGAAAIMCGTTASVPYDRVTFILP